VVNKIIIELKINNNWRGKKITGHLYHHQERRVRVTWRKKELSTHVFLLAYLKFVCLALPCLSWLLPGEA